MKPPSALDESVLLSLRELSDEEEPDFLGSTWDVFVNLCTKQLLQLREAYNRKAPATM